MGEGRPGNSCIWEKSERAIEGEIELGCRLSPERLAISPAPKMKLLSNCQSGQQLHRSGASRRIVLSQWTRQICPGLRVTCRAWEAPRRGNEGPVLLGRPRFPDSSIFYFFSLLKKNSAVSPSWATSVGGHRLCQLFMSGRRIKVWV